MKHEWRKKEKGLYLPKNKPEFIEVPALNYFVLRGEGNPNSEPFAEKLAQLYALSYAVRMAPKKNRAAEGYFDYTVYPLEGVWDLNEKGRAEYDGTFDKDNLVYQIMIRQPDFVDAAYAQQVIEWLKVEKPNPLLEEVSFESQCDGPCVQMLHHGSYDSEPASFAEMEAWAEKEGLTRASKTHREIYLSDARKVPAEKLKTTLRFKVLS